MTEAGPESLLSTRPALFAGLPHSDCTEVLGRASDREYLFNDIIFWAGQPVKEVLLLTAGLVKITHFTEDGLEVILRLNIVGEIVGVPCVEHRGVYSSTAQALQASSVLVWDAATFREMLEEFPLLGRNAAFIIAQRLVELESRFCEVATARVAIRLARAVVRLLDQMGHPVKGHTEINVSQEVLAQMTSMTASTVSRLLTKWEQLGVVSVGRGVLVIRNLSGLQLLCQAGSRPHDAASLRR